MAIASSSDTPPPPDDDEPPQPPPPPTDSRPLFEDPPDPLTPRHPTAETAPAAPRPLPSGGLWSGIVGAIIPDRIGAYTITRLIGAGGMGAVFEAIQDNPHRAVALKLIKSAAASAAALRRFQTESAVLARLHHPCIAQIYEAGTHETPAGSVPFFAMELVGGSDLALSPLAARANAPDLLTHARTRKLTIAQRLELFAPICDAVHHAHDRGVIHRDLKPANILVDESGALGDTRVLAGPAAPLAKGPVPAAGTPGPAAIGLPKIIDFGIARAIDPGDHQPSHTTHGHPIGTLAYMSPEQTIGDPNRIDHRTDIYSLGVILYELLTGVLPYDTTSVPPHEGARRVRDAAPPRPSRHNPALRGDVENVVLKALSKDRAERYQTGGEMRDDLQRVLAGQTATAKRRGPVRASLRGLSSFAGNHPFVATAAALAFAIWLSSYVARSPDLQWPNIVYQGALCKLPVHVHQLTNVCVISIEDNPDYASLLAAGFPALHPTSIAASRAILADFIRTRMPASGAAALATDIVFFCEGESLEVNNALADAIRSLEGLEEPIHTVLAYDHFEASRIKPRLLPIIRNCTDRVGLTRVAFEPDFFWGIDLFCKPALSGPRPSLALAVAVAAKFRGYKPTYFWDTADESVSVSFTKIETQPSSDPAAPDPDLLFEAHAHGVAPYDSELGETDAELSAGLDDGDLIGRMNIHLPQNECFDRSRRSLLNVRAMSDEQLRDWIGGRVVLLADLRPEVLIRNADVHVYPDGRELPGAFGQAMAIEALLGGPKINWPTNRQFWVWTVASATLGAILAWVLPRSRLRRVAGLLVFSALIVLVSVLAFQYVWYVLPPFSLLVGMGVALAVTSRVVASRRARLV